MYSPLCVGAVVENVSGIARECDMEAWIPGLPHAPMSVALIFLTGLRRHAALAGERIVGRHREPIRLMNAPSCRKLRSVRSSEKSVKL